MRRRPHRGFPLAGGLLIAAAAGLGVAPAGWALPAPATLQQQAAEAVGRHLNMRPESQIAPNLQVLAPFTSLPSGASLQVISIKPGSAPGSWLVRLDCTLRRDCLPFDAVLRMPGAGAAASSKAAPPVSRTSPDASAMAKRLSAPPLARRGDHAELVAEMPGIRLQTQVICRGSGGLGDQIQVETLQTHRILTAIITGEDTLKVVR